MDGIRYESSYYGVCDLGDSLTHHGIKGQKWGVRRYQNPDGSLTQAGKARYLTDDGKHLTKSGERKFRREMKKLQKLKDRTDIDLQQKKAQEYEKRSETAGKVARVASLAFLASKSAGIPIKVANLNIHKKHKAALDVWDKETSHIIDFGTKSLKKLATSENWAKDNAGTHFKIDQMARNANAQFATSELKYQRTKRALQGKLDTLRKIDQAKQLVSAASLGTTIASLGVYGYNKAQASRASKRMTSEGHAKAVEAYEKQLEMVKKEFGDVKLSDLKKRR